MTSNPDSLRAREKFNAHFPKPHSFITALHSLEIGHALEGAKKSFDNGADGVALVTHILKPAQGVEIIDAIKQKYPHHQAILNVLQESPLKVFQRLKDANIQIDGVWTDNARIYGVDNDVYDQTYADQVKELQYQMNWNGVYFGPVNFKHQKQFAPEELGIPMSKVKPYLDVITTSGPSTGYEANAADVALIKMLAGKHPVALASGLSPENIKAFIDHHDLSIVATGISKSYRELDDKRVFSFAEQVEKYNKNKLRKEYEKDLLEKYNVASVAELKELLKKGDYINISSGNDNQLEKSLSNLFASPFVFDGISYASVEAFYMAIKYPEDDIRRIALEDLTGLKAKLAGNGAKFTKVVYYKGQEILIGSLEHYELIKRAIKAKLEQNLEILQLLLESGNKKIVHIPFTRHENHVLPDSRNLPAEKFSQIVSELREEFR